MIAYVGLDELIVCEESAEALVIQEYFTEGGRDIDDYNRLEVGSYASCSAGIHLGHAQKKLVRTRAKVADKS